MTSIDPSATRSHRGDQHRSHPPRTPLRVRPHQVRVLLIYLLHRSRRQRPGRGTHARCHRPAHLPGRQHQRTDAHRTPALGPGIVASRRGDLDGAVTYRESAFEFDRMSVTDLLARTGELGRARQQRYQGEQLAREFQERYLSATRLIEGRDLQ